MSVGRVQVSSPLPANRAGGAAAALSTVLRRWTWRHTGIGCALGLFNIALGPGGGLLLWPAPAQSKQYATAVLFNVLLYGLPMVLTVRWADLVVDAGASAWRAYTLAVVGVAVVGSWAGWLTGLSVWGGHAASQARNAWLAVAISTQYAVGVAAYVHWRRARQSQARLHAAETERAQQVQALQSQRLLALQAQVEPRLLFDTLQRVQGGVQADAAAADVLLADLIALLRAMLPRAGAPLSDVQRELALLQAHASVTGAAQPRVEASDVARRTPIAPMLALPLLRSVQAAIGPAWPCVVQVRRDGDRLVLSFAPVDTGRPEHLAQQAADAMRRIELGPLHERLADLHGDGARLTCRTGPTPALLLELPCIDDHCTDR